MWVWEKVLFKIDLESLDSLGFLKFFKTPTKKPKVPAVEKRLLL